MAFRIGRLTRPWFLSVFLLAICGSVQCFRSSIVRLSTKGQRTSFLAPRPSMVGAQQREQVRRKTTSSQLNMFMGSDGGLLGVGTPEVFTILLVGYFVLGPSDLYKLVKEIGKFIQNIRTLGNDLTTTLETNMESQLQLQEIRKAQQELNDAFSFRRTINVNQEEEAFSTTVESPRPGQQGPEPAAAVEPAAATATTTAVAAAAAAEDGPATRKKKKIRRRVKRAAPPPPAENPVELEMPAAAAAAAPAIQTTPAAAAAASSKVGKPTSDPFVQDYTNDELAQIDADFDKYTLPDIPDSGVNGPSWYDDTQFTSSSSSGAPAAATGPATTPTASEASRFQQQLSGEWNQAVINKTDELSPLSKVMEMIALLEKEKVAANQRLEDEFRQRAKNEEDIYRKQRQLLEEAAQEVQQQAFSAGGGGGSKNMTATTASVGADAKTA